ncbi:hypothetical protein YTPLAS18_13390 [Nitrospira sp.]|nr:hypothetical protein YTPLAS18_13390 [Nitrospira sp.]
MANETRTRTGRSDSRDQEIEQLRRQLHDLMPFLTAGHNPSDGVLEEFDSRTELLIREALGETSEMLEAYEYAQVGEAAGLVNFPDEAPEGGATMKDHKRESLNQRKRVIESCIAELEASRAQLKKEPVYADAVIGPQVAHHMTPEPRSVYAKMTLREAARFMHEWRVGSLLVTDDRAYVGMITDSDLARVVVAGAADPATTPVGACMRQPLIVIESDRHILDAVRMMKEMGTRHLAVVDNGDVIGVISVSNILRYYSGVL